MKILIASLLCCMANFSFASVMTYNDRTSFENALLSHTTVNTSDYIGQSLSFIESQPIFGGEIDFFGPSSTYVRSDDLILNGAGFFGGANPHHVGINFLNGVNGVGVSTNAYDGGDIIIYDGLNGTGTELGRANFGDNLVLFGGITSTSTIRSAVFTCDFNYDLKCGLRDPVYGKLAANSNTSHVPEPSTLALFGIGLAGMLLSRRKLNS